MLKESYNVLEEEPTEAQGYLITCMRTDGALIPCDYYESTGERFHFTEESYAAELPQERFTLFVTEDGVCGVWWLNPLKLEGQVTENVEILPFEQVQSIFVQTLKNGLSWSEDRYPEGTELNDSRTGHVEEAILSYTVIPERNSYGEYLMVPTWIFSFRTEASRKMAAEGITVAPYYIAINAVDGTRIELQG